MPNWWDGDPYMEGVMRERSRRDKDRKQKQMHMASMTAQMKRTFEREGL
jgi:hypothetical protein